MLESSKDDMALSDGMVQLDLQTESWLIDSPFQALAQSPWNFTRPSPTPRLRPSLDEIDTMVARILARKKQREAEAARAQPRVSTGGEALGNGMAAVSNACFQTLNVIGSFVDGRKCP